MVVRLGGRQYFNQSIDSYVLDDLFDSFGKETITYDDV